MGHFTFANHLQNCIQNPALKVNSVCEGIIHTLKKKAEALVAATREIGLEVRAD